MSITGIASNCLGHILGNVASQGFNDLFAMTYSQLIIVPIMGGSRIFLAMVFLQ